MEFQLLLEITQIGFLRNFLDHVCQDVDRECSEIEKRGADGEFDDYGDYEAAFDYPVARLKLAAKTALYELNALTEARLQVLAEPAWRSSLEFKGPKSALRLRGVRSESPANVRMISDVPVGKLVELIELHYAVRLSDFEGWEEFQNIRQAANAFKHRQGLKHNKEINWWSADAFRKIRYDATVQSAQESVSRIGKLLQQLRRLSSPIAAPRVKL